MVGHAGFPTALSAWKAESLLHDTLNVLLDGVPHKNRCWPSVYMQEHICEHGEGGGQCALLPHPAGTTVRDTWRVAQQHHLCPLLLPPPACSQGSEPISVASQGVGRAWVQREGGSHRGWVLPVVQRYLKPKKSGCVGREELGKEEQELLWPCVTPCAWCHFPSLLSGLEQLEGPSAGHLLQASDVSVCAHCLLSCHWASLRRTWLHLLCSFPSGVCMRC